MRKLRWALLAGFLLVAPLGSGAGGKKKGDLELAQGTWVVVSVETEGKPMSKRDREYLEGLELVVTGEKVLVKKEGAKEKFPAMTLKVNPKTRPKSVDITLTYEGEKPRTVKGIYSLEGDRLKLCIGEERPTDFTTKENSKRVLGVFKRKGK
jgi:uncharacterized protein (TIGR03067 family)